MKKKTPKPILPLAMNEALYICRLSKLYGMSSVCMPSGKNGREFNSVKVKSLNQFDKDSVKTIKEEFFKTYKTELSLEYERIGEFYVGYFLKRML